MAQPSSSKARLKIGSSCRDQGWLSLTLPPSRLKRQMSPRFSPPEIRIVPSGASAMAIGPMPAWLLTKPSAKTLPTKGRSTLSNSLGRVGGVTLGMPCCASWKTSLVDGRSTGGAGRPKLGGVLFGTCGSAPRLAGPPSAWALMPGVGFSRLPAMSVDRARNS